MRTITGRRINYSSMTNLPNVDTMCDVLVTTQNEMGQNPSMKEAEFDKSGNKIRRFKRNYDGDVIDTRTGEVLSNDSKPIIPVLSKEFQKITKLRSSDSECPHKQKPSSSNDTKKKIGLFERGFVNFYNGEFGDDDEDDDDEYICEYCTDLGYTGKYKSYICDNCTKCETCSDFINGKCDGCTYSRTRTGHLYSDTLTVDQIISSDDLEIIESMEDDDSSGRRSYGRFTVLDY